MNNTIISDDIKNIATRLVFKKTKEHTYVNLTHGLFTIFCLFLIIKFGLLTKVFDSGIFTDVTVISVVFSFTCSFLMQDTIFNSWSRSEKSKKEITEFFLKNGVNPELKIGDSLIYKNGFEFEESFETFKISNYKNGILLLTNNKKTKEISIRDIFGKYKSI